MPHFCLPDSPKSGGAASKVEQNIQNFDQSMILLILFRKAQTFEVLDIEGTTKRCSKCERDKNIPEIKMIYPEGQLGSNKTKSKKMKTSLIRGLFLLYPILESSLLPYFLLHYNS